MTRASPYPSTRPDRPRAKPVRLEPARTYEVRLAPAARRQFRKLPPEVQSRVGAALKRVALASGGATGERGGKAVKQVRGRHDRFIRLRVGDYRVMYDAIDRERVLLVLGIVHRRDLERWLRGR